ncbi:MAG: DUF1780 domain-containing protein [bacterium]
MDKEQDTIKERIGSIKEAIDFLSNKKKPEREYWVVEQFLLNLGIDFTKEEIKSVSEDPPDVIFREANFEIKEILEKNRKRHQGYKNDLKTAKKTRKASELLTSYTPQIKMPLQQIVASIHEVLEDYRISPEICNDIDLLFYVNLDFYKISSYEYDIPDRWRKWRSVSIVENGGFDFIFWAKENAPDFIKLNVGKIIQNNRITFD